VSEALLLLPWQHIMAVCCTAGVMVGQVNGHFVLLPQSVVTLSARRVDPKGKTWNRLRGAIGQPRFQNNSPADMPAEKAAVRL
jgi:6-phosphofructokinase 1